MTLVQSQTRLPLLFLNLLSLHASHPLGSGFSACPRAGDVAPLEFLPGMLAALVQSPVPQTVLRSHYRPVLVTGLVPGHPGYITGLRTARDIGDKGMREGKGGRFHPSKCLVT